MNSAIRYTIFIFSILLLTTSCGTIKHLKEGETLLQKNKIKIKDKKNVDDYRNVAYELTTKTIQKPNPRFLGLPSIRPWFYYRMQKKEKSTWWTRFVTKNWADPPAIYSLDFADQSAKNMEQFLQQRGYFNASVDFTTKKKGLRKKKMEVKYQITAGPRYYFDTIQLVSNDPNIDSVLQEIKGASLLRRGEPVDERLYDQERQRITNYLKNIGYANFYTNYFSKLEADSIGTKVNAELEVLLTKDSTNHRTYRIGNVSVVLEFDERGNAITTSDSTLNDIKFYFGEEKPIVKLKALEREIFLKKGEIYKIGNIEKTRLQLSNLDIFQFIDVRRITVDPLDSLLDYEIRLIPKKRQEFGYDLEVNNSRVPITSNSFLGTSVSLNYKNRNFLRGGEVLSVRAQGGVEFSLAGARLVNAWDLNLNSNLDFPRYYDVWKTDKLLLRALLGKNNKFYQKLREQGISSTSLSYSVLANRDNYRIDRSAGSIGWRVPINNNWRVAVSKAGLDFLDSFIDPDFFDDVLSQNPSFERSLRPKLLTGFGLLFRDVDFLYRKESGFGGKSSFSARFNLELSGVEVWAANRLRNIAVSGDDISFRLFNKFEFSQFYKLETDLIHYRKFTGGRLLASRVNIGLTQPYGFSSEVPYVEQFFVGRPNSMRAWKIRELGPGGYLDPSVTDSTVSFFQTGNLKFEMNAEYRFNLFWYFKGAIFIDAGNVWSTGQDDRPDSGIDSFSDFFNEIAIGSGIGLRMDLDFFILRFDLGYKLRNPYPDEQGRYWLIHSRRDLAINKFLGSLSVGYPF